MDTAAGASALPTPPALWSRAAPSVTLGLLSLTFTLSFFDRMLMIVLGEMIKGDFHLSDKQLSILTGAAFVIIYGVVGVGAGWLLDRTSRKRILAVALTLWSVATMACGLAGNFVQLAIARAGVGIGEAANVPAALAIIADLYPPAKRSMACAIFYIGGMVGILATFLFGTWVAAHFGWRAAFFAAGPPGIVLAVCIYFFCGEPVREGGPGAISPGERVSSFQLVRTNRALVWTIAAGGFSTFGTNGMMQWLPMFFIRSHHLGLAKIGLYFGPLLAGGMTVGMLAGGFIGNHIAKRSVSGLAWMCSCAVLATAPLFILMLRASSSSVALGLMFLATAVSATFSPIYTSVWQTVCDARARGSCGGIQGFVGALVASAICPFAVGALSDYWAPTLGANSLRYALMASMVFMVLGSGLFAVSGRLIERQTMT